MTVIDKIIVDRCRYRSAGCQASRMQVGWMQAGAFGMGTTRKRILLLR